MKQLHIDALEKLKQTFDKAAFVFGRAFAIPRVTFDLRGKVAGTADCTTNHIRLNDVLLSENGGDFIEKTIPHEAAHLIARAIYGRGIRSHGVEWKGVMRRLGLVPTRCHTYDTTNATVRNVAKGSVYCACSEHKVTLRVIAKIQIGRTYTCRKCKTAVRCNPPAMMMGARV